MMDSKPTLSSTLRAGRVVLAALMTRTGQRRPLRLGPPLALVSAVALGAGGSAALSADAPPVADAQRAQIETVVRDYILDHPEIIPQAIERLREKEMAKAINDNRADIETPYGGAWEGAKDGDVVLTVFFDYACPYCRSSAPEVARILAEDRRLKIVYRELPILGDESVAAARVALLAADTGHYPAFHKAMFDGAGVTKAAVLDAAGKAGLDRAKVQAILAAHGSADEFTKNVTLAQALSARGTPLYVVGNQVLHGDVGYDALKDAIAKARTKKG